MNAEHTLNTSNAMRAKTIAGRAAEHEELRSAREIRRGLFGRPMIYRDGLQGAAMRLAKLTSRSAER